MATSASIRTARRRRRFLEVLGETGIVAEACRAAGAARGSFYNWRRDDPDFADDWNRALSLGIATLEDEAIRRARDGVETPVYYRGSQVGTVRRASDTLLMFLLRAHKPALYRERPAVSRWHDPDDRRAADRPGDSPDPDKRSPEDHDMRIRQFLTRRGLKIVHLEDGDSRDPENPEKLPIPPP